MVRYGRSTSGSSKLVRIESPYATSNWSSIVTVWLSSIISKINPTRQGRKLDPQKCGPFLPLFHSPPFSSPPLLSSSLPFPAPSPPLSCPRRLSHLFSFSSPPPNAIRVLGALQAPTAGSTYFAAILSPENVSGGSDFVLFCGVQNAQIC